MNCGDFLRQKIKIHTEWHLRYYYFLPYNVALNQCLPVWFIFILNGRNQIHWFLKPKLTSTNFSRHEIRFLLDICTKFDNLCSQTCEATDDSYVCKCESGFKLDDDKRTCIKQDEDQSSVKSNEVPINSTEYGSILVHFCHSIKKTLDYDTTANFQISRDCPVGYNKNEDTDGCDDIDECEERTDLTCNMATQVCLNTPGSYQCLEIHHVPVTCPSGFTFDPKVKQCIGSVWHRIMHFVATTIWICWFILYFNRYWWMSRHRKLSGR